MWIFLAAALVACGSPPIPPASPPLPAERVLRLAPGAILQADMTGGETHVYRFDLPAGGFADLAVEQLGIDVAVRVEDPRGLPLAASDSFFGPHGPEPVPVVAGTAGTHRLRVHAPGTGKGRYEIRVAAVRPATGQDRDRVEAERRFSAGEILRQRGDRASLEAAVREETAARDLFRSLGERGREADVLYALGFARVSLDSYAAAAEDYRQSLALFRTEGREREAGRTLNDLALAHRFLGDSRRAAELYQEALALNRRVGDRWAEATSWNGLGRVYDVTGETENALSCYEKALALWRGIGDRRRETSTLKNLGELYLKLGDSGKALEPLNAALVLAQAAGQDRETGALLALIGQAHSRAGQHARGIDLLRRALDLQRRAGDLRGEAVTLNDLGWAWLLARRPREARDCFARSIPLLHRLGDGPAEAIAWASLGWADNELDRPRRAAESFARTLPLLVSFGDRRSEAAALLGLARARRRLGDLPGARSAVEEGIRRIESLRAEAAGPDLRTAFFASKQDFYTFRVDLLMAMGDPEGALLASEEARSRTLLDLLAEAGARRRAETPAQGRPASLREIQGKVVDPDTLLLEYSLGEERSFLWAVTPDSVAAFELPPREEIEETARRAYDLLTASGSTLARGRTSLVLDELSRVLIQPAAGLLGSRRLLIVPDGALHLLPFAALPVPGADRPLVADHEIVTAPSASSLALLRREVAHRAPPPGTLAVVADPVFAAGGFRRLPYSRDEAEAILAFAPPEGRLGALGPAANREAVLGSGLGRYRIVHFATHGVLDTERPERSGIALSRGFVRAGEIYRLDLPADLVVLSACRTALGKSFRGEGVIGLTRAFQYAGARSVLVSLWEVEDRATAELMRRFYREMLVAGRAPAAALRAAQLSLRREPGWGAPYFWAGFVLQGDGEASR
ncbi:MAG TPA: CHAT domain-containing tetratricopeptide repeat protein [Thermoanaerobaculia bacterium]